jgi:hypothetical protein
LQGEPVVRYRADRRAQQETLAALRVALRALHAAGAQRIVTLHTTRTEWVRREPPLDTGAAGGAKAAAAASAEDAEAGNGHDGEPLELHNSSMSDMERDGPSDSFEAFLDTCQRRGASAHAVHLVSVHQVRGSAASTDCLQIVPMTLPGARWSMYGAQQLPIFQCNHTFQARTRAAAH